MVCSCAMPSNCIWLQIILCTCVKETVLFSFLRSLLSENGRSLRFPRIFIKKQTRWSNDKTIIELGYRKISWFVSVSQINYLPQPSASANTWSVRHRQITIFCSTSSNNCYFLFRKPRLGDFVSTRLCAYKLYLLEILYWNHTMLTHHLMAQNVSLGCLQEWMKKISV